MNRRIRWLCFVAGVALAGGAFAQAARTTEDRKTMPPKQAAMPAPATTAAAPPAADAWPGTFAGLDKDKDGRVSSTEASADATFDAGFSAMDANADGFVTDEEYRGHMKATSKPTTNP